MTRGPRRLGGRAARRGALGAALVVVLAVGLALWGPTPGDGRPSAAGGPRSASGSISADWATLHGSENRSGYTPFPGPPTGAVEWIQAPSNGSFAPPIRASPVVNATRVYVADILGGIYALDRATGNVVWRAALGNNPVSPDLSGGFLYDADSTGAVIELNGSTGRTVWSTPGVGVPVGGVAVANSKVFVTTTQGRVVALDATSGTVVWSRTIGPIGSAPSVDGGTVFVVNASGAVDALAASSGALNWSVSLGAAVDSEPAVAGGRVVVGDERGVVTALNEANGSVDWTFNSSQLHAGDSIEATPGVSPTQVFVDTDLAHVYALNVSSGAVDWQDALAYTGYTVTTGPAVAPNGVYVVGSAEVIDDLDPSTGRLVWSSGFDQVTTFASPAIQGGGLVVPNDAGEVAVFQPAPGTTQYPVDGKVTDPSGVPVVGAIVVLGSTVEHTDGNGSFSFAVSNGSYVLSVLARAFVPVDLPVTVAGPVAPITVTLHPVELYLLTGNVLDADSGHGLGGVLVLLVGPDLVNGATQTEANGSFSLEVAAGSNALAFVKNGYTFERETLQLTGNTSGLVVSLPPTGLVPANTLGGGATNVYVTAGLLAALVALGFVTAVELRRRRVALGLPPSVTSPFARFLAARATWVPFQIVLVLTLLYIFGEYLPAAAFSVSPCSLYPDASSCDPTCTWQNAGCIVSAFGVGWWAFIKNLFTGDWGLVTFGALREPAIQFMEWWLRDSIELAAIALALSVAIAYPVGLLAGRRKESAFDSGSRVLSAVGLLVPSFLLVLLFLEVAYQPFSSAYGDPPFGTLPSSSWYLLHGGFPTWIGPGGNTFPTGFPLIDGIVHQDWPFEALVATKTLIQAAAIAFVYTAVFLRYARHAVAEAMNEPHVTAARARGVTESTLLWRHTGRRVWPIYLLVFGATLPAFLGTQALIESMFNDAGVGTLLLGEMTHVGTTGFGFSGAAGTQIHGNFYQVVVFLLLIVVLLGNLAAEVLARYLDPRLAKAAPT